MRSNSVLLSGLAAALAVLAILTLAVPSRAQAVPAVVTLELNQQFFYAGDDLNLRISVRNPGATALANPVRMPLSKGFQARTSDGRRLEAAPGPGMDEPTRPEQLASQAFYGGVVDIARMFPELRKEGTYEIYWSGNGITSNLLGVTVIPRYDPSKDYVGEIVTDHGTIELDLFQDRSPIAVKSFIDLANTGFYEGLEFQEVHADDYVVGGDPRFVAPNRKAITYPAELSALPLVAGTIAVKPVGAAPPTNGPAFIIMLKPQPAWTGQITVLGQVIKGLDIIQKISKVPSSMRNSQPHFKPLKPVTIQRLTIREKTTR